MLLIQNIKLQLEEDPTEKIGEQVKKKLRLNSPPPYTIFRESIDARRKDQIRLVYQVLVDVPWTKRQAEKIKDKDVSWYEEPKPAPVKSGSQLLTQRPVIVGAGPSGLFAAYQLAQAGYSPLILERGRQVQERAVDIAQLEQTGRCKPDSNVQFGEGGAGAWSDGKLTTRIKDKRVRLILEALVEHGAPPEILYSHKPHIGTDLLRGVVERMRQSIERMGGEFRFDTRVDDLRLEEGFIRGLQTSSGHIDAQVVLLCTGHSARDTYRMLHKRGVQVSAKPFAVGFRIEHPQSLINQSQYGQAQAHPRLGPATYHLTWQMPQSERAAYTFCMCPGGVVMNGASAPGQIAVNGMSYHARDLVNANSALLCTVTPEDFGEGPLSGIDFQEKVEQAAFALGGSTGQAPAQRVEDFLQGRPTTAFGEVAPSFRPGVQMADLSTLYPPLIIQTLRQALPALDRKMKGFALPDAVLTGVETRSSAPLRIARDPGSLCSVNVKGLYPAGEGAGYAGGIISSAVDGLNSAEQVIRLYAPGAQD